MSDMAQLIEKLNDDLKNEWRHLRFYLYHASAVTGLHAHELKEFLLEQAASEMRHVQQFSDMIFGLGGEPTTECADFPKLTNAHDILQYAADMELEVVRNYVDRIITISHEPTVVSMSGVWQGDKKWLEIFLEEQIKDSREDLDHLRRMLTGIVQ